MIINNDWDTQCNNNQNNTYYRIQQRSIGSQFYPGKHIYQFATQYQNQKKSYQLIL